MLEHNHIVSHQFHVFLRKVLDKECIQLSECIDNFFRRESCSEECQALQSCSSSFLSIVNQLGPIFDRWHVKDLEFNQISAHQQCGQGSNIWKHLFPPIIPFFVDLCQESVRFLDAGVSLDEGGPPVPVLPSRS